MVAIGGVGAYPDCTWGNKMKYVIPFTGKDNQGGGIPPNFGDCSELPLFRRRYREFSNVPDDRI